MDAETLLLALLEVREQAASDEESEAAAGKVCGLLAAGVPKVHPSPFVGRKSLADYLRKDKGQPCEQGETAAQTGCVPASGEAVGKPSSSTAGRMPTPVKTAAFVRTSPEAVAHAEQILGFKPEAGHIAAMVGDAGDSTIVLGKGRGGELVVRVSGKGYESERKFYRDEDGGLVCRNESIEVKNTGKGLGTEIFARQVEALAALGVTAITAEAKGHGTNTGYTDFNGYYTWPRLGYDGDIPVRVRSRLPSALATAKTVQELYALPGGREWWKADGSAFRARFDLAEGSQSRRILAAYLKEKGK